MATIDKIKANGTTYDIAVSGSNVSGAVASAGTLTGLTATVAELNYVDGVKSNIQTQIDNLGKSVADGKGLLVDAISNASDDWGGMGDVVSSLGLTSNSTFAEIANGIDALGKDLSTENYADGYHMGKSAYGTDKYHSVMPTDYAPSAGNYLVYNIGANHYLEAEDESHFIITVVYHHNNNYYEHYFYFTIEQLWANDGIMHFSDHIAGVKTIELYIYTTHIAVLNHSASQIVHMSITDYQVDQLLSDYDYGTDDISAIGGGSIASFDPEDYV